MSAPTVLTASLSSGKIKTPIEGGEPFVSINGEHIE